MLGLEEIADWWDTQFEESQEILQDWVNESDSDGELYARAAGATVVHTTMQLGAGLVDLLRLGEGIEEGGVWGYTQDALRVLSLAGPVARLGRLAAARWTFNPRGGFCASIATTRTLRHSGTNLFIRPWEVFAGTGATAPRNLSEFVPFLRSVGARFREVTDLQNLTSLTYLVHRSRRSVVLFGVNWTRRNLGNPREIERVGHALYAYRNSRGRFVIADRTGRVVRSLDDLKDIYRGIENAELVGSAIVIHNSIITEGATLASMLAVEANIILHREGSDREVVISPMTE